MAHLFQEPIWSGSFTVDCNPDFQQFAHIIQVHSNKINACAFKPGFIFVQNKLRSGALSAEHRHGDGRVRPGWFYITCVDCHLVWHIYKATSYSHYSYIKAQYGRSILNKNATAQRLALKNRDWRVREEIIKVDLNTCSLWRQMKRFSNK